MADLDASVRMISLQFSFSNPKRVPASVKVLAHETPKERDKRKSEVPGEILLEPKPYTSLGHLLDEIAAAGYELADAFYKPRIVQGRQSRRKTYHMVRFIFVRKEYAEISEQFSGQRDVIMADLRELCEKYYWRARAYLNYFFMDGAMLEDQYFMSINLEVCISRFWPDGQPMMESDRTMRFGAVYEGPVRAHYVIHLHPSVLLDPAL